jgi:GNAT superfamily N-acetyltransferase
MDIRIRKAVAADCERMMQLIHELAVYERAPEAVTVDLHHFIESGFGPNPVWQAFVACNSTAGEFASSPADVCGFALYYTRYSTWKGQRMYLEDLLVTESMRGRGIGKMLFDKLIEECKSKSMSGLVWQVLDWNEPAINFYKKYAGVKFEDEWLNCSIEM